MAGVTGHFFYEMNLWINQKANERVKPQKTEETNMKRTIRARVSPKETASKVPTIGLNTTGVRNESPLSPNFAQKRTIFRFLGENNFRS